MENAKLTKTKFYYYITRSELASNATIKENMKLTFQIHFPKQH